MKLKLIIPILILSNMLVFGFNFAQVYELAQGKPTVKVDVPVTTPEKLKQAQDDPNFVRQILPDENYKIPKPATRKEAVDDAIDLNKQKLELSGVEKIDVTLKILPDENYKNTAEIDKNRSEYDRAVKLIVSKLNLKVGEYYTFEGVPNLSVVVDKNQLESIKSIPEVLAVIVSKNLPAT